MKGINQEVIKTIVNAKLDISTVDMVGYLLCMYYNLYPSYLPLQEMQEKAEGIGLIEIKTDIVKFLIPLFKDNKDEIDENWKWVEDEYIPLFKEVGKGNPIREVLPRMKKIFANNPDIRKDEVIEATKMYIRNTITKYIRESRYFIMKGVGVQQTSDLLTWIDNYRKLNKPIQQRDLSRTMQ